MLSRRKQFRAVVSAKLGKLGPNRPEREVWHCVLSCGHKAWRPSRQPGEVFPKMAPKRLICDEPNCKGDT